MTGRFVLACLGAMAAASVTLGAPGPAAAQEGNAEDGAEVFKKCRACHDIGPDAKNKVGPRAQRHHRPQGRHHRRFPLFRCQQDAGGKGLVWTEEVLFKYLENPLAFMPGTKMAFAGLKDPQDRKDVIAYLKKFTKK